MAEFGQPKFRAAQLAQWLYVHHVNSYDQMTNLSLSLRSKLTEAYPLSVPSIVDKQVSHDGTRKTESELKRSQCLPVAKRRMMCANG